MYRFGDAYYLVCCSYVGFVGVIYFSCHVSVLQCPFPPSYYRSSSACLPSFDLTLTCHSLHEVVIPHLLYKDVRLVGEDQALPTLNTLIAKVKLVNEEVIQKKGNPSPSHYIHHLYRLFNKNTDPHARSFHQCTVSRCGCASTASFSFDFPCHLRTMPPTFKPHFLRRS